MTICPTTGHALSRTMHRLTTSTPTAAFTPPARSLDRNPLVGTVLDGRYRIIRLLGSGGMGHVFEAENVTLRRLVAVKVVTRRRQDVSAIQRLDREARVIASIQHPNICDVYDVGAVAGLGPYIVLERLVGETLAERIRRGPRMSVSTAVDVFAQILSGLHAAHQQLILHRDLKPANVFLVERVGLKPLVKLVDFGFAKDLSGQIARTITQPGRACGTPAYMSPEQLRAQRLDARSDLFSVGAMLFEALTRRHPFAADNEVALQTNILRSPPLALRPFLRSPQPALEAFVNRALEKDRAHRFGSALEMQRALLAATSREENEPASGTGPLPRLSDSTTSSTPSPPA